MARLDRLPETAIIDGFRGVLDFYVDNGVPVVRSWPKKGRPGADTGSIAYQGRFARVNRWKPLITDPLKVAFDRYRTGGDFLWGDVMVSSYFGKLRPFDGEPPTT